MMERYEDVKTSKIALVGFLSAVLIFTLVILMQVLFYWSQSAREARLAEEYPPTEAATLEARQRGLLADYRWVDQAKNIATIPISRAMELVVADIAANPNAATPPQPAAPPAEKNPPQEASDGT